MENGLKLPATKWINLMNIMLKKICDKCSRVDALNCGIAIQ